MSDRELRELIRREANKSKIRIDISGVNRIDFRKKLSSIVIIDRDLGDECPLDPPPRLVWLFDLNVASGSGRVYWYAAERNL